MKIFKIIRILTVTIVGVCFLFSTSNVLADGNSKKTVKEAFDKGGQGILNQWDSEEQKVEAHSVKHSTGSMKDLTNEAGKFSSESKLRGLPGNDYKDVVMQMIGVKDLSDENAKYIYNNLNSASKQLLETMKGEDIFICDCTGERFEVKGSASDKLRALIAHDNCEYECLMKEKEKRKQEYKEKGWIDASNAEWVVYGKPMLEIKHRKEKYQSALKDIEKVVKNAHIQSAKLPKESQKKQITKNSDKKGWGDLISEVDGEIETEKRKQFNVANKKQTKPANKKNNTSNKTIGGDWCVVYARCKYADPYNDFCYMKNFVVRNKKPEFPGYYYDWGEGFKSSGRDYPTVECSEIKIMSFSKSLKEAKYEAQNLANKNKDLLVGCDWIKSIN